MDDPEVVAAIAAGDLDGLAAALDRYAGSLYGYCCSMAPEVAAGAVQDTFIIAWSRLGGLRDPGELHSWLQAVAGNECFRRTLPGVTGAHAGRAGGVRHRPAGDAGPAGPVVERGDVPGHGGAFGDGGGRDASDRAGQVAAGSPDGDGVSGGPAVTVTVAIVVAVLVAIAIAVTITIAHVDPDPDPDTDAWR